MNDSFTTSQPGKSGGFVSNSPQHQEKNYIYQLLEEPEEAPQQPQSLRFANTDIRQRRTRGSGVANNSPNWQAKAQLRAMRAMKAIETQQQKTAQLKATQEKPSLKAGTQLQAKAVETPASPNGLPEPMKSNMEAMGGVSLDDVKVNRNSAKPAEIGALAYAQGSQIELSPGQEKHLAHEAWHTVQQKQGRVQATTQAKGVAVNDDARLEKEADVMGAKVMQLKGDFSDSGQEGANIIQRIDGQKENEVSSSKYVVKEGDTLWGIAEVVYGNGKYWNQIRDANPKKTYKDGDLIHVGTEFNLPRIQIDNRSGNNFEKEGDPPKGSVEWAEQNSGSKHHETWGYGKNGPIEKLNKVNNKSQEATGDLKSPKFSKLADLELVYDSKATLSKGSSGRGVQAIQHALYDLGFFKNPQEAANGEFSAETQKAVKTYQKAHVPSSAANGIVDSATIASLDNRFEVVKLPSSSTLSARWTPAVVKSLLEPWSPHTIKLLQTKIDLHSFDSISWADEEWDGKNWVAAPFPGGGYNTGKEIGIINDTNEGVAEILYHEVIHADQPKNHQTSLQKESYAYRIGEEFSIAMGFKGIPELRSTDEQEREFADPAKVDKFVEEEYPSVPVGGVEEEIRGKGSKPGEVMVLQKNGSIYIRGARVGEKVPGPISTKNEVAHDKKIWK